MNTSDFARKSLNTDFVGRKYAFEAIEKLNEKGFEIYRVVIELFRRWIIRTQK